MHRGHRHPRPRPRLSRRHRISLYLCGLVLLMSGSGWLLGHYLLRAPGAEAAPHPSEVWWLRLHGAAMIGFLVCFGALLTRHVPLGWRERSNRGTGVAMVSLVSLLALTGYALYYLVDDTERAWASVAHWSLGLIAAAALVLHATLGSRVRHQRESAADHHPPR